MRIFTLLFLTAISLNASAQKLPTIQPKNLLAPANIKTDGKADEWGAALQAYNPGIEVSYTLANDANNLYLVVQTTNMRIFEKIISVGTTLTINKNRIKDYKAADNKVLTYPLLEVPTYTRILGAAGSKSDNVTALAYGPPSSKLANLTLNTDQNDSLKAVAAKMLKAESKTIKLQGFTGLPDTLSIYNEHNIAVANNYEKNGTYTYELQIPLKLLELVDNAKPFAYSIKLRSRLEDKKKGTMTVSKFDKAGNTINPNQDLDADTDLWGEYTLAK